jgi:high-affinity iron transporter
MAAGVGFAMFAGPRKLPLRTFFGFSTILLVLFAAGLASMAVGEFTEAGLLPALAPLVNLEFVLPQESAAGGILRGLFGYSSQPTWFTIGSWLAALVFGLVMIRVKQGSRQNNRHVAA